MQRNSARQVLNRALTLLLSMSLAFGCVPAQAWAEVAQEIPQASADDSSAGSVEAQGTVQEKQSPKPSAEDAAPRDEADQGAKQEDDSESEEQPAEVPDKGTENESRPEATAQPEGDPASNDEATPESEGSAKQREEGSAQDATDVTAATSAADATPQASTVEETASETVQVRKDAKAAASAYVLADNSYLKIQDTKDKNSGYSNFTDSPSVGTTLWANMYDHQFDKSIAAESDWAYQWLSCATKSSNPSDYEPVEGQTSQSLTIDEALARSLAGRYLAISVTAGGKTYYGPGSSNASITIWNLPDVVMAPGAAKLYSVGLDNTEPAVGDTITATAYVSYNTPVSDDVEVSWVWTADGETIAGAQGSTLTIPGDLLGKKITVSASAGANTQTKTTSEVAPAGSFKLYSVELDTPASAQVGTTLTAHAYQGSYSSKTEVTEGVTFTWLVGDAKSYSTTWSEIEGESSQTLVVPESCEGKYIRVKASAGRNTVEVSYSSALGPFKQPGAYTIYTAHVFPEGATTGNNAYTTGDTLWALARETSGGPFIPADGLTYQWMVSETGGRNESSYAAIDGATAQTLSLKDLAGRYVGCKISSKIGTSSYFARVTKPIAKPGSVNITTVSVTPTGERNPGDVLTATAGSPDGDVTNSEKVSWSWGMADSSSGSWQTIEGATAPTLTITEAMVGKYLKAYADGGFGATSHTQTVGPVVPKGAVSLYKVELSGEAVIGKVLTAQAYKNNSTTKVADGDTVSYEWQYSTTKTTSDTAFKAIGLPTSENTFTVPETAQDGTPLVGCYLRVRAISKDAVVSTSVKSYYGSTPKDPLGPVRVEGGYDLTDVKVSSSGKGAQVGNVLTPKAQYLYQGSYSYNTDVPADAKVTYVWHASDADGTGDTVLTGLTDETGRLTLDESLVGCEVWCVARALMTPATSDRITVRRANDFDLLRMQLKTPSSSSTTLVTGDELAVDVYAKRLDVTYTSTTGTADNVTDRIGAGVTLTWYTADTNDDDAEWEELPGENQATLTISDIAAGRYLRAVATSGDDPANRVSYTYPTPVLDGASLPGIIAKLSNWRPEPHFGTDTNVNDMLLAKLQEMGIDTEGLEVRVTQASFNSVRDEVSVGVSTGEDDNGTITYLWADLDKLSSFYPTSYQTVKLAFELTRGEESATFTPSRMSTIGWDEDKARAFLQGKAAALEIGYAEGDAADSVTSSLTLPIANAGGSSWAKVTGWSSDSVAIKVNEGYSWSTNPWSADAVRGSADTTATLTATVGFTGSGMPDVTVEQPFTLVVKADPAAVEAARAELADKLANGFSYEHVSVFGTGGAVDPDAVTSDLQLPTTRTLGVDGKLYSVSYTSDNAAVDINAYHAIVVRPLPGSSSETATITCTVTLKDNPEVTASVSLPFVVQPLSMEDIDGELDLMAEVKASYLAGIINGNDPAAVTGSLHGFAKAYRADDGSLAWSYSASDASSHTGIVPSELPGYDPMGSSDQARLFSSSAPQLIQNENLVLTGQVPTYDTQVKIASRLTSERFAAYYDRYRNDPTAPAALLEKLAALVDQPVEATVTVPGTLGPDTRNDDEKTYVVTVRFVGPDSSGKAATWGSVDIAVRDDASVTAADVTRQALADKGWAYEFAGNVLESITSPATGQAVANEDNGDYWQLWVSGAYSGRYATLSYLKRGDRVTWQYASDASKLNEDAPALPADGTGDPEDPTTPDKPDGPSKPSPDAPNKTTAEWAQSAHDGNVTTASTPTTGGKAIWSASVRAGEMRSVSEPLVLDMAGSRTVVTFSGRNAYLTDAATGKVTVKKNVLTANMSLTTRPAFDDGIIYVPLNGGRVQAIDASTMRTLWTSKAVGATSENATCSTRVVGAGGRKLVVVGTSQGNDSRSGTVAAIDAVTGKIAWAASNAKAGYYWGGAAQSGSHLVIGDSAGVVHVLDAATGAEVSRKKVTDGPINADVVSAGSDLLVMGRDGMLSKVRVSASGNVRVLAQVKVGAGSTAAPTVVGGRAICTVCGPAGDEHAASAIVVVDLKTMRIERTVKKAGGTAFPGGIKTAALASVQGDDVWCYVTCNDASGQVYLYRLGDAEAKLFFVPSDAQRCDSPLVCDADGNLYYLNDSGTLVMLAAGKAPKPSTPTDSDEPADRTSKDEKKDSKKGDKGTQASRLTPASGSSLRSVASEIVVPGLSVAESLLADVKSTALLGAVSAAESFVPAPETAMDDVPAQDAPARRLPWWPLVGMALGTLTLVACAVRRNNEDEEA